MIFYDSTKKRKDYFIMTVVGVSTFVVMALILSIIAVESRSIGKPYSREVIQNNYDAIGGAKLVALTFDDGPDPIYTPEVLAILKEKHVPATFFMTGKHVAEHPYIAKMVADQGHEIGNHTFSHSEAVNRSKEKLSVELTLTSKVISQATGKTPVLYRPPFLDETGMTIGGSRSGITPEPELDTARALGYVVVGADIDSRDWDAESASDIFETLGTSLENQNRHVILFHDGGGDRSLTVAALPAFIDSLKEKGYVFVPVSTLIGLSKNEVMPASSASDTLGDTALVFVIRSWQLIQSSMGYIAIGILLLTLLRIQTMLLLRYVIFPKSKNRYSNRRFTGTVSVIVPAYNEEANVCATVMSVLNGTRRPDEIIVVDDGSKDATSERVKVLAAEYPEVKLIRVSNGGKARALNIGIAYASTDIVVCIDGDTMFHPKAIEALVRHFDDPRVGVVAGKVVPIWRDDLLNKFQMAEYLIGQNIDKEVFSGLGAVGVVPGAIGAWRKNAIRKGDGYPEDTIVEDQDLTLSFLEGGYSIVYEAEAMAYTEAPSSVHDFLKQRFRWVFGTFQCTWKYRSSIGSIRNPGLGLIVLPNIVLFNFLMPLLTPFIDISVLFSIVNGEFGAVVIAFLVFSIFDILYAALAITSERDRRYLSLLLPIFLQRIFYRYVMFYVVLKSVIVAICGTIAPKAKWTPPTRMGHAQAAFDLKEATEGKRMQGLTTVSL